MCECLDVFGCVWLEFYSALKGDFLDGWYCIAACNCWLSYDHKLGRLRQ